MFVPNLKKKKLFSFTTRGHRTINKIRVLEQKAPLILW